MSFIKKISNLSTIGLSKVKEKAQESYLKTKAEKIDKEIKNIENSNIASLQCQKNNISNKIEEIKKKEKLKRQVAKSLLKSEVKESKGKREEENKNLNFVSRMKKEFKGVPVISLVDDIVEGASDIERVQKMVQNNPDDPYCWLILAQCINYYKKAFFILNLAKSPVDPLGTVIDLGTEFGGEYIEEVLDKDKWTYKRALLKSINLSIKSKIKDEKNLVCIGRSAQLLAMHTKEPMEKDNFNIMAKKYLREALKVASLDGKNEILFYLGEIDKKNVKSFKYAFNNNIVSAVFKGTVNAVRNQSKKILNTSERIIDKTVDSLLKD
ncbi:hypothetical protein [Clostridium lundense]|uniref:hypothetical protein n=1 Tax=Clostridium lundense TaxID=319475 RepID=UPI00048404B7|nr:hypothetical protein [Clostridium lundense]